MRLVRLTSTRRGSRRRKKRSTSTTTPTRKTGWRGSEGDKRVWGTPRIDVIFDPDINGGARPFSLYLPEHRRPIYEDRTKPLPQGRAKRIDPGVNPQAVIDHRQYRKRQRELHRTPSFEERPLRFRTIYGAIEEAERRERMLRGEVV
jgi:hypothetical protein